MKLIIPYSKIILFYLTILTFVSNLGIAQWINQPFGSGTSLLRSIHFINDQTGWIVGNDGLIRKTTNQGLSWLVKDIGTRRFYVVYFLNENTGFIAGDAPYALMTTNGGDNWAQKIAGPENSIFTSIFFTNNNTGWIGGGEILGNYRLSKTTDGGNTWSGQINVVPFMLLWGVTSIDFADINTGWLVGYTQNTNGGIILKTTNGGQNWNYMFTTEKNSVQFFNVNTGYTAGINMMKTTDGGVNWVILNTPKSYFNDIYFLNENTGWAVGNSGINNYIIKTTNSGINWSIQLDSLNLDFYNSITFVNSYTGWAVGSKFISTTNGGSVGIKQISSIIPKDYSIKQNYPNPFNPITNIEFSLPEKSFVKLKVFDISGRQINDLVYENLSVGTYKVNFDGSNNSSGVYFYTLETDKFIETKRMVLLK